jgi:hypothetical protein
MLTLALARRVIASLRKPFVQRLIALVVSALLAMSLISTTIVFILPLSGHEVASSASGELAQPAYRETRVQSLVSIALGQGNAQATPHNDAERRPVWPRP